VIVGRHYRADLPSSAGQSVVLSKRKSPFRGLMCQSYVAEDIINQPLALVKRFYVNPRL
jgi:hypothetical protein